MNISRNYGTDGRQKTNDCMIELARGAVTRGAGGDAPYVRNAEDGDLTPSALGVGRTLDVGGGIPQNGGGGVFSS